MHHAIVLTCLQSYTCRELTKCIMHQTQILTCLQSYTCRELTNCIMHKAAILHMSSKLHMPGDLLQNVQSSNTARLQKIILPVNLHKLAQKQLDGTCLQSYTSRLTHSTPHSNMHLPPAMTSLLE